MNANHASVDRFGVFAQAEGSEKPLFMTDLTFARLMDDIVVPYQSGEAFFIDGARVEPSKLAKLKLVKLTPGFKEFLERFHNDLRTARLDLQKLLAEQYHLRLEAMMREQGEDVTSQIIKAYDRTIKPSLKDYIPKREELISAALNIFMEGMKMLSK